MRLDERIPNLLSKLKKKIIFNPIFVQKWSKNGKIADTASFRQFFGQKGSTLSDFNIETRFGILSNET